MSQIPLIATCNSWQVFMHLPRQQAPYNVLDQCDKAVLKPISTSGHMQIITVLVILQQM